MNSNQFRAVSKSLLVQATAQSQAKRIRLYGTRHKSRHLTKADGRKSYRAVALKPGTLPLKPSQDAFNRPALRPQPYANNGKYRLPGGTQVLKHTRVA